MSVQLTKQQVNTKYKGKYVKIITTYDYSKQINLYEVLSTSRTIKEDMTLGEDVGTPNEYRR